MEHARKFILVPNDREQQFTEEHLSDLDNQMHNILSKKNIDENVKVKQYLQVLQKYVTFPELSRKQENSIQKEEDRSPEEDIVSSAPVKHRDTSKKIIQFLNNYKDIISWTASKELVLRGIVLPGTNVDNLFNFLLRNQRNKPKGFEELKSVLDELGFPLDFIKNKYLKPVKTLYAKPYLMRKKSPVWIKT